MSAEWQATPLQGPAEAGELLAFYKETAERLQIELGRTQHARSGAGVEANATAGADEGVACLPNGCLSGVAANDPPSPRPFGVRRQYIKVFRALRGSWSIYQAVLVFQKL